MANPNTKTLYSVSDDDKKKVRRHGFDRISRLSDEIIAHILSFLDIKGAGRTSILSRRWRNVWTKLVDLSIVFDEPNTLLDYQALRMPNNKYVEWVNQVVARHSTLLLDSFKLHFRFDCNHLTHIDKWLRFAFQKAVRNLELNLSTPTDSIVSDYPYQIYHFTFDFMPFSDELESLILLGVDISGTALQFILYNCHNLKRLSVKDNKSLSTLKIDGSGSSSLKLKHLELFSCYNLRKLEIFANNLTSLLLWGSQEISVEYHHVPSLVEVHFDGPYSVHLIRNFHHLSGFSSQLEKLSFVLSEMIPAPVGFPAFTNVKTLELKVVCHDDDSLLFVISYLEACPLLHNFSLKISRLGPSSKWSASRSQKKQATSICRHKYEHKHKHLKVVKIVGFDGSVPDVQLVLNLVNKYALKLDKIIFDPRHPESIGFVDSIEELSFKESKFRAAQLIRRLPPTLLVVIV